MKILSVLFTTLFLIATTSVAQVRFALENAAEMPIILLNFAMAFCIYMLTLNSGKIISTVMKNPRLISAKKGFSLKAYRIS